MSEWQMIETAPKDGTYFLGYEKGIGIHRTAYHVARKYSESGFRIFAAHGYRPTHWMPLPEPPK